MAASQEHEAMMNDVSSRMASSRLSRRSSRGSTGQASAQRRRSARIEKPRSIHGSPRVPERRKTTTAVKQYASLDDHYQMMFGSGSESATKERGTTEARRGMGARPLSWHPSSSQFSVESFGLPTSQPLLDHQAYAAYNNQLQAYHRSLASQQPQDQYTQSHQYSNRDSGVSGMGWSRSSQSDYQPSKQSLEGSTPWNFSFQQDMSAVSSVPACTTSQNEPVSWYLQDLSHMVQAQLQPPPYSDFLPIQYPPALQQPASEPDTQDHSLNRQKSKELIGMGLYDPPDNSTSLLAGGLLSTGKGLKLEETWQPPADDDDEDDEPEEAGNDASSDEEDEEEPPPADDQQWPLPSGGLLPTNMSGQSFFFDDDDETCTNEWWYQQLKYPTVTEGGYGYGWL